MKRLVITADDFGVAPAVNEAVEQAHRHGVLTAASLMVNGDAAADAVARARTMPALGVGLHLVLVEGTPALPPERVPDLVDSTGRFRRDMVRAAIGMFALPRVRRQLAAEIDAQFALFAATGLPLDHVNAHKHFHLHPTIASAVLRTGKRYGMRSVRAPVEPWQVLASIEPDASSRFDATRIWAQILRRRLRKAGMIVPDAVFGLAWSGAFDADRLGALVERLPDGLTEIYTHPATDDRYPDHAPGYAYRDELAALLDAGVAQHVAASGAATGSFAAMAALA